MSKPTDAPANPQVPTIDELHKRNLAFVAKLDPVMGRLRELMDERRALVVLNDAAYDAAEAATGDRSAWAREGEDAFGRESGSYALGDALGELLRLAKELEDPDDLSAARFEQLKARREAEGTWTPIRPGASDEEVRQVVTTADAAFLAEEIAAVREAIVGAQHALGDFFTTVGRAWSADEAEELSRPLRAALAEVLLTAETTAQEAGGVFARRLEEAS